jgi:hypothetical protein
MEGVNAAMEREEAKNKLFVNIETGELVGAPQT